jgi:ureidoacrylate peracid hydrolase
MHQVAFPPGFLDGIIARRGRLERFPKLDAAKTALVVIDLQNVFMLPGMPVAVPAALEIIPNVNRLATGVREAGGRVVWVKMKSEDDDRGWEVFARGLKREYLARVTEALKPGSHGYALHADLQVQPEDHHVTKTRFSAFIQGSSPLDSLLHDLSMDTVIVAGTLTNVCCESTARDAMMLNYKTIFPSDANAALSDAEHNATLQNMMRTFADVCTVDELLSRFEDMHERPAAE